MNISQRIYINSNDNGNYDEDKYIKFKLDNKVDTLELMSLSFRTEDFYQNFNSDYGVLVGRVIANEGVGVPNAKISIFIPVSDEDLNNSDVISVYPYKTPRDNNNEGKRYNLLPRVAVLDENSNTYKPKQPFGSFPIKPEIITNETLLNVYKKYYKYSTVTNEYGDYMIFGVPVGIQTVHMSVDITDIGKYSMNPAAMVTNLGYSPNLFTDNNTKIKPSNDLNDLPHIEMQEISVDVIPFWGDSQYYQIGITRQDFRIRASLTNTFTIFGSVFTDADGSRWGNNHDDGEKYSINQLYRISPNENTNISIRSKRTAKVTEKIYYYPNSVTDAEIKANSVDLYKKMRVLDPSEYTIHKRDGDFIYIVNCNRRKIITNVFGVDEEVPDSFNGGVYTEFKGFITLEIVEDDLETPNKSYEDSIGNNRTVTAFRSRIKIPQKSDRNIGLNNIRYAHLWRNEYFTFSANTIYSIAKFNPVVINESGSDDTSGNDGFEDSDVINTLKRDPYFNVGVIKTTEDENELYEFPSNGFTDRNKPVFGANWLNFSIHLPQIGYTRSDEFGGLRVNTYFEAFKYYENAGYNKSYGKYEFLRDNNEPIAGSEINTKWFLRSDLHWTDFIIIPENDIKVFNGFNKKGGNNQDKYFNEVGTEISITNYMSGSKDCPIGGGKRLGIPSNNSNDVDPKIYFYKGLDSADCIEFVSNVLNIV